MSYINNRKAIKATANISGYICGKIQPSWLLYLITSDKFIGIYAKQFICKTKDEINYNIFIINTRSSDVTSVKLLDILPTGTNVSDIKSVTLEGKIPIAYTIKNNSIEFSINSMIKAHLYSRVVVTIQNNSNIDIESNTVQIEEVT